jgi:guanidinopropionase
MAGMDKADLERMAHMRYTGQATFMRTPYRPDDWDGLDIGILGVPYDGGTTNRPGARHGPRELRNQSSLMRLMNQATGVAPYNLATVADIGDAYIDRPFELQGAHDTIRTFLKSIADAGVLPLTGGGDHSISLPILQALGAERPVGMIHIDAHCDTSMGEYLGSRFHHGAPFSRAVEDGVLDPKRTIQIGIRGGINDPDTWQFSHESGMRVIYMHQVHEMGLEAVIAEARRVVGDGPTYLSFDIDALDPAFAPGTGTPEMGGFSSAEALALLRGLRGLNYIGADLVEVSPPFDPSGNTALAGATIMFEILCLLAESLAKRA